MILSVGIKFRIGIVKGQEDEPGAISDVVSGNKLGFAALSPQDGVKALWVLIDGGDALAVVVDLVVPDTLIKLA